MKILDTKTFKICQKSNGTRKEAIDHFNEKGHGKMFLRYEDREIWAWDNCSSNGGLSLHLPHRHNPICYSIHWARFQASSTYGRGLCGWRYVWRGVQIGRVETAQDLDFGVGIISDICSWDSKPGSQYSEVLGSTSSQTTWSGLSILPLSIIGTKGICLLGAYSQFHFHTDHFKTAFFVIWARLRIMERNA